MVDQQVIFQFSVFDSKRCDVVLGAEQLAGLMDGDVIEAAVHVLPSPSKAAWSIGWLFVVDSLTVARIAECRLD